VVGDDRVAPLSGLSSSPPKPLHTDGRQSASFEVVGLRLELSASPGAARLVIAGDRSSETYVVEAAALAAWAVDTTKLLSLESAGRPQDRMAIRTPFLVDREGRPSIAFEALVSELGVGYPLLVGGDADQPAGLTATADVVQGMAQAAAGAATLAGPPR